MRRLLTLLALSAGLLLVLSGTAFADAEVEIGDAGLDPETVNVDVREPIIWTNTTDQEYALEGQGEDWESGPIAPGATFSIEITEEGTYRYVSADGSLSGEIIVGDGGKDPFDEPTEDATEDTGGEGNGKDGSGGDEEPLAETGTNATVPAGLSLLLIGFGGGLLALTEPRRRRT